MEKLLQAQRNNFSWRTLTKNRTDGWLVGWLVCQPFFGFSETHKNVDRGKKMRGYGFTAWKKTHGFMGGRWRNWPAFTTKGGNMREIAVWVVPYIFRMQKVPTHIYFLPPLVVKQQTIISGGFFALNCSDLFRVHQPSKKLWIAPSKINCFLYLGKTFKNIWKKNINLFMNPIIF